MEKRILTDEEVIALDTILVEGNEKIIALHLKSYSYGIRWNIDIPTTDLVDSVLKLEDLDGKPPIYFEGYIRAVVNDTVYISAYLDGGMVSSFGVKGAYEKNYSMGDMAVSNIISPILQDKNK